MDAKRISLDDEETLEVIPSTLANLFVYIEGYTRIFKIEALVAAGKSRTIKHRLESWLSKEQKNGTEKITFWIAADYKQCMDICKYMYDEVGISTIPKRLKAYLGLDYRVEDENRECIEKRRCVIEKIVERLELTRIFCRDVTTHPWADSAGCKVFVQESRFDYDSIHNDLCSMTLPCRFEINEDEIIEEILNNALSKDMKEFQLEGVVEHSCRTIIVNFTDSCVKMWQEIFDQEYETEATKKQMEIKEALGYMMNADDVRLKSFEKIYREFVLSSIIDPQMTRKPVFMQKFELAPLLYKYSKYASTIRPLVVSAVENSFREWFVAKIFEEQKLTTEDVVLNFYNLPDDGVRIQGNDTPSFQAFQERLRKESAKSYIETIVQSAVSSFRERIFKFETKEKKKQYCKLNFDVFPTILLNLEDIATISTDIVKAFPPSKVEISSCRFISSKLMVDAQYFKWGARSRAKFLQSR